MFELNKSLASVHRFCTRNQNVDFRGPFLLGTENPSSWELSSQTSLFASKTNVLLMFISICGCCEALRRNWSDSAKVRVRACRAHHSVHKVMTSRKANNVRFRNICACALCQTVESGAATSQPTVYTTTTCSFELSHYQLSHHKA